MAKPTHLVMDRGIPTEEILAEMRASSPKISYLVGTPKGRLTKLERELTDLPWQRVREGVNVKLLSQDEEVYIFAESSDRKNKEHAMRRRQLKRLWKRLKELQTMKLSRDALLLKLGAAKQQAPSAWRLVDIKVAEEKIYQTSEHPLRFLCSKPSCRCSPPRRSILVKV